MPNSIPREDQMAAVHFPLRQSGVLKSTQNDFLSEGRVTVTHCVKMNEFVFPVEGIGVCL